MIGFSCERVVISCVFLHVSMLEVNVGREGVDEVDFPSRRSIFRSLSQFEKYAATFFVTLPRCFSSSSSSPSPFVDFRLEVIHLLWSADETSACEVDHRYVLKKHLQVG